jgi:hypothetical protein
MNKNQSIEHKEELEWFISFANMDLDAITPGDKAKLLVESDNLFPVKEIERLKTTPKIEKPFNPPVKQIIDGEEITFRRLDYLEERSDDPEAIGWAFGRRNKESREYWLLILKLKSTIQKYLDSFIGGSLMRGKRLSIKFTVLLGWGTKKPYTIDYFPITESQEEYLQFKIFRLLEGFPSNALNKCPTCENFFLNPSLRKKTFCSPRCMWRANSAKRREKDPEGYKEYQRNLMKDRYREKTGNRPLKVKSKKHTKEV